MDDLATDQCRARSVAMWTALEHREEHLFSELVADMLEAGQVVEMVAWLTAASLAVIERIAQVLGVETTTIIQNWALAPLHDDPDRADP